MKPPSDYLESTMAYYDQNAAEFCAITASLDMSALYEPFLRAIPAGGRILDAGCGSGRDSASFLRLGYRFLSMDASREMVKATTALTGQAAVHLAFEDLEFDAEFDGIWACASMLHLQKRALGPALVRLGRALKPNGALYLSFKLWEGERVEGRCLFNDMTEHDLSKLVLNHPWLQLDRLWLSADARTERRGGQTWVNAVMRRVASSGPATACDELLRPPRLWTGEEILSLLTPVPTVRGVYAWYLRRPPASVPVERCLRTTAFSLLYVGISPSVPPTNGTPPSKQNLLTRNRYFMRGNAEGSTFRLPLGCLLRSELGTELRRVGSGSRMTFGPAEAALSEWLSDNARMVWVPNAVPWKLEEQLIFDLDPPLNLDQNSRNPFWATLSRVRREANQRASELPILA